MKLLFLIVCIYHLVLQRDSEPLIRDGTQALCSLNIFLPFCPHHWFMGAALVLNQGLGKKPTIKIEMLCSLRSGLLITSWARMEERLCRRTEQRACTTLVGNLVPALEREASPMGGQQTRMSFTRTHARVFPERSMQIQISKIQISIILGILGLVIKGTVRLK